MMLLLEGTDICLSATVTEWQTVCCPPSEHKKHTVISESCIKDRTSRKQEHLWKTENLDSCQEETAQDCPLVEGHLSPVKNLLVLHRWIVHRLQSDNSGKGSNTRCVSVKTRASDGAESQSPRSSFPFSESSKAWQQWAQPQAAGDDVHLPHSQDKASSQEDFSLLCENVQELMEMLNRPSAKWNVQDGVIYTSPKWFIPPHIGKIVPK